jgi:hypothetical protein
MNIEFAYRYRDFGNFKSYNSVVLGNRKNLAAEEIHAKISGMFTSDPIFEASLLKVPEMFFKQFPYDPDLDWAMHEYIGVSGTDLPVDDLRHRDITDLLAVMEQTQK